MMESKGIVLEVYSNRLKVRNYPHFNPRNRFSNFHIIMCLPCFLSFFLLFFLSHLISSYFNSNKIKMKIFPFASQLVVSEKRSIL